MKLPNDKFCVLPWISLEASPIGTVRPCCLADEEIVDRVGREIIGLGIELKQYKKNKEKCKEYNLSSNFKGKKGKSIYFEVDNNQETRDKFDDLALEYISSDFHRFDSCLMSLKKIGEYVSDH